MTHKIGLILSFSLILIWGARLPVVGVLHSLSLISLLIDSVRFGLEESPGNMPSHEAATMRKLAMRKS